MGSWSGNLGTRCHVFRRLQGLRPRGNRSHHWETFNRPVTDLPLMGFHLLMVSPVQACQVKSPATVALHTSRVRRQIRLVLRSTACPPARAALLSREGPAIPRFLASTRLPHFDDDPVRGYQFPSARRHPSRGRTCLLAPSSPSPATRSPLRMKRAAARRADRFGDCSGEIGRAHV